MASRHPESRPAVVTPGAGGPLQTGDGVSIRIDANVDLPDDVPVARRHGAQGIGLFRSEVLIGSGTAESLTEERQYQAYRRLVEGMAPHPVTIRTFDLDENRAPARRGEAVEGGWTDAERRRSPLGVRGIRLSLLRRDLFECQLRAMLRAAAHGSLRLLLPFVSTVDELLAARVVIAGVQQSLRAQGLTVPQVPVGAMIEVPAAALAADLLARHTDFLAIGTNDLIQYTLAVDRTDDRVSTLYHPLNPGLLRLLRAVRRASAQGGRSVSICGEMASDPLVLAVLIGLGFTEFSMTPRAIPAARRLVRAVAASDLRAIARRLLSTPSTDDLERYLEHATGDRDRAAGIEQGA
jgi:phosphotransferase system enzyme I (PtsI)